jgi:hypothetical protein
MEWTAPTYAEIKMDAEIGSYQEDFDGDRESPIANQAAEEASAS